MTVFSKLSASAFSFILGNTSSEQLMQTILPSGINAPQQTHLSSNVYTPSFLGAVESHVPVLVVYQDSSLSTQSRA